MADAIEQHRIVVIGGGNAGTSVAGRLRRSDVDDIVLVEPRAEHRYQPLFSHVAGGRARFSELTRPQERAMPRGVRWIRDAAVAIDPHSRTVALASGASLGYGQLIVCPGIQRDWGRIPGLPEALETPAVASHYEYELVPKTSRMLRDLRAGTVVFVEPSGPASCAGASQKPMYLACDYWRRIGVLRDIRVVLVVPTPTVFGVPIVDGELERKIAEYGIELRTGAELVAVDGARRTVVLAADGPDAGTEELAYDALVVVPPQSAPDWLTASALPAPDDPLGFVEVDARTLRHPRFPAVWSLGDAAATTNAKSGGALRRQTSVLAQNLHAVLEGRKPTAEYDGYTVAPFTVSRSTVVFAEFDDRSRPRPTVPFWPGLARERRFTWIMDRWVLPWVYWHLITKGRA